MARGADEHQALLADRAQPQPARRLAGQCQQGQVELPGDDLAGQPVRPGGGLAQVHGDLGVRRVEPAEQPGQVDRAGGGHGADGEGAAQPRAGLGDRILGRLGSGHRGAGLGQQGLPGVGERDPVPVPVEQHRAEFPLQGLDRAGHPGLDDVQPPRSPGERQFLGDNDELPELVQSRQLTGVITGAGLPAVLGDHHHLPCRSACLGWPPGLRLTGRPPGDQRDPAGNYLLLRCSLAIVFVCIDDRRCGS